MRKPSLTERASGARSAQDMRKRNGAGAGSPCPARSFKRISYKRRLLINLGLIVALPPMTAKSQATKFLAFLLRFTKKIWFWLQHAKVPRILHAMNGICWNPHARKSAQGRSARGPNIPKSYRNFRQPPATVSNLLYVVPRLKCLPGFSDGSEVGGILIPGKVDQKSSEGCWPTRED